MSFYDSESNIEKYIEIAKGYDGRELIEILKSHISSGASVLELGSGPGVDLEILNQSFDATGSDFSKCFIKRLNETYPDFEILEVDVKNIELRRKFDCVYSNKVLVHLNDLELAASLKKQVDLLSKGGILFHTFWFGDKQEMMEDLLFNYINKERLNQLIPPELEVVEIKVYKEMEENDSVYIILKR